MHPNSNLSVKGNLQNEGAFGGNGGTVTLSGTSSQIVSGSAYLNIYNLTLNNSSASGVSIENNSVNISQSLILTDGYLNSSATGILTMLDNSISIGGSENSFVTGPIRKEGNDSFQFPVGKGNNYQPVSISAPSNISEIFIAEYLDNDPTVDYGTALDLGIDHISSCESWSLEQQSGTSQVEITLGWNSNSCGVTVPMDLLVAHWDTTKWLNMGNGGVTGNSTIGTIKTMSQTTRSGIYTLASTSSANPLPVELISFEALKWNDQVKIEWATASERDNSYFTVERTIDGFTFETVDILDGIGTSNLTNYYNTNDENPEDGLSYYRLKQTDIDGKSTFSELRAVYFGSEIDLVVFPNPGSGEELTLVRNVNWKNAVISIFDCSGKQIY